MRAVLAQRAVIGVEEEIPTFDEHDQRHREPPSSAVAHVRYVLNPFDAEHLYCLLCDSLVLRRGVVRPEEAGGGDPGAEPERGVSGVQQVRRGDAGSAG